MFNDLLWALTVLRTDAKFPITAALLNLQGGYTTSWNVVAAGALIAAVPTTIVFFAFQRHFVSGLFGRRQQVSWILPTATAPVRGRLRPETPGPVLQDWTDGEIRHLGSERPAQLRYAAGSPALRSCPPWAPGRFAAPT